MTSSSSGGESAIEAGCFRAETHAPILEPIANVPAAWSAYWEHLPYRAVFESEAALYVDRLLRHVDVGRRTRVLDFGCGFGLAARELALHAGLVCLWDASPAMRRRAAERVAGMPNVRVAATMPTEAFDLVLVHSVVQYLPPSNRCAWLRRWRAALTPVGRVVVSDVPDGASPHGRLPEIMELVKFHARNGRLLRVLGERARDAYRYWRAAHASPLVQVARDQLRDEATQAGFDVAFLPESLTCRERHRFAAVLTATGA